jgi:hypothetical protein
MALLTLKIRNSKHEFRNKHECSKYQFSNLRNVIANEVKQSHGIVLPTAGRHVALLLAMTTFFDRFWICFGFRYSDFGFPIGDKVCSVN